VDAMNEARTLAVKMAQEALSDLPTGVLPDLWENLELETEAWEKLKVLSTFGNLEEMEGFHLSASSRAGFMLGLAIGQRLPRAVSR